MLLKRARGWVFTVWTDKKDDMVGYLLDHVQRDEKIEYAIFGHEISPTTGTKHLQGYVYWTNAVTGKGAQKRLGLSHGEFHAEAQRGTHAQASDYCKKEGNIAFVHGDIPDPADRAESAWDYILLMIEDGKSDFEIMKAYPAHFARCKAGITAIRSELAFQKVGEFRDVQVTYIWGETGTGKTRSILESADHPSDVYKVVDYKHPFDNYRGQSIILFDEFRSSIRLEHMLNYIDGYIVELPCRYHNKVAMWDKVYIVSNIPMEEQFPSFQDYNASIGKKQSWDAWLRRIDAQVHMGHLEGNNSPLDNPEAFEDKCHRALKHQVDMRNSKLDARVQEWEDSLGFPLEGDTELKQGLGQFESTS